ncbi:UPF0149 family protein [candidate division KSB1 bacterium]|nr:UPF0149 family protein [candidate division KSB1 bacterium]
MLKKYTKLDSVLEKTGLQYMPIDMLNGYICAVICSSEMVPPSEWLPLVFFADEKMPDFSSIDETKRITSALLDVYNETITAMGTEDFGLLIADGEAKVSRTSLMRWCHGFALWFFGRYEKWTKNLSTEHLFTTLQILQIANVFLERIEHEKNIIPSFIRTKKQILEFCTELIIYIQDLFFFRLESAPKNIPPMLQESQKSAIPKWGRNQPCPCGSGKKFKKCCGAHTSEGD